MESRCKDCGAKIKDYMYVCPICGAPILKPTALPNSHESTRLNATIDIGRSKQYGVIICALIALLFLLLMSGFFLSYNYDKREKSRIRNGYIDAFIINLYDCALNRQPDEKGREKWVSALQSREITAAQVVSGIVLSPEYMDRSTGNEEHIATLYRALLNRDPKDSDVESWISVLENGCTKKAVLAGLLNSDEFGDFCNMLDIQQGKYISDEISDQNPRISAFVARFYKICLGRDYEQSGLNDWVEGLLSKRLSGSSVARGFFKSDEFTNRNLDDEQFLKVAYRTLLNREPDEGGMNTWLSDLKNTNRIDVISGFTSSSEFDALCEWYGIEG